MEPHEPHLDIKLALTKMVQSWKNVSLSQIHLLRMIGITNETYKAQVVGS